MGNFFWLAHTSDGLCFGEFFKHFSLPARIIFLQITIYKWRVYPTWRNTVASYMVFQKILSHRQGHAYDSAFGCGIRKALGKTHGRCNGSEVEHHTTFLLHDRQHRMQAMVYAFYVYIHQSVEISRLCRFGRTDVCHTCIIHQNINRAIAVSNGLH